MAVTGSRPYGAPPYVRENGWEENDFHVALRQHAREMVEAARETVAHSRDLRWRLDEAKGPTLTSRCAWCGRHRIGDRWLDRAPPTLARRTTDTICGDCVEALDEDALSASAVRDRDEQREDRGRALERAAETIRRAWEARSKAVETPGILDRRHSPGRASEQKE